MKGTRPLSSSEILLVANQFTGTFAVRNRSLFMLGVSVGGRISELLALTIGDVWQNGKPVSDLLFLKDVVKGKGASRLVPVNRDGQQATADLIQWHHQRYDNLSADRPLFRDFQKSPEGERCDCNDAQDRPSGAQRCVCSCGLKWEVGNA